MTLAGIASTVPFSILIIWECRRGNSLSSRYCLGQKFSSLKCTHHLRKLQSSWGFKAASQPKRDKKNLQEMLWVFYSRSGMSLFEYLGLVTYRTFHIFITGEVLHCEWAMNPNNFVLRTWNVLKQERKDINRFFDLCT